MNFRSNSELVRHLIQELLSDGEVHSLTEITDYVLKKSETYELKGPLTMAVLTNTFGKMLRAKNSPYVAAKRGHYVLANMMEKGCKMGAFEKASKILEQTEERIKSCFVVKLVDSNLDVDEIQLMSQRGQTIGKLLQSALEEAKKGQQEMEEKKQQKLEDGMQMNL